MNPSSYSRVRASCLIASWAASMHLAGQAVRSQVVYQEIEPNDSKTQANVIGGLNGMLPGDSIVGITRCTSPCGLYGPDYFLIRTAPAPLGLYRYQLIVTSDNPTNTYAGVMLGTHVTDCQPGADQSLWQRRFAPLLGEWCGFGKQERLYWLISGGSSALAPYTATLYREEVPSIGSVGPLRSGAIRIDAAPGSQAFRVFVFDAAFNAIPAYDGFVPLDRSFAPGTYHIVLTNGFAWNNLPCPVGELRSGLSTDFPDSIVTSSPAWSARSVRLVDPTGHIFDVPALGSPYAAQWLTMRVYDQNSCGSADFDGDGDSGTSEDIEAFFLCLAGECCVACDPHGQDFNSDGDPGTDADIESFFRVLGGGTC